jgi:fatty acid amide hydrolase
VGIEHVNEGTHRHITDMGAAELASRIKNQELTSVQVTEAFIRRIEEVDPMLNAVVVPLFSEARALAIEADKAVTRGDPLGPLHGVPVTIKEQFNVRGTQTTLGLQSQVGKVYDEEGPLLTRLRQAGAVILGKTNVPQLLVAYESDNRVYGRTNNPWDLERSPGGSSGGEAAIIAARGSPLGLGGDLGGSIRVPCHFSGITGLKPSAGRLTLADMPMGIYSTGQEAILPQAGPMARNVDDLILMMEVMVGEGESDIPYLVPPVPWRDPRDVDVSGLRVGKYTDDGLYTPSPAMRRGVDEAAEALVRRGAQVVPFQPPDVKDAFRLFLAILTADGGAGFKRALGREKPHQLTKGVVQAATLPPAMRPLISRIMSARGQGFLAGVIRDMKTRSIADYWDLVEERGAYRMRYQSGLDDKNLDAVLCPPYGTIAVRHGASPDMLAPASYATRYNVLGLPAGVVPVTSVREGEESDRSPSKDLNVATAIVTENGSAGLPVGVQVVGRYWREDVVLALMKVIEEDSRDSPDYPSRPVLGET